MLLSSAALIHSQQQQQQPSSSSSSSSPPPPLSSLLANNMAYSLSEWFHQHSINRITPHDISIAILIDITRESDGLDHHHHSFTRLPELKEQTIATNKFIMDCIQHVHTPIFGTINRFITELTNVNPDLVQPFISTFSSIDNIDALFTLFDKFKTIQVNKTSIFGIFLRKIILIFNNLLFDGVKTLFDNLMKYKSNQPMLLLNQDTIECTFQLFPFTTATTPVIANSRTTTTTTTATTCSTTPPQNSFGSDSVHSVSKIFPKLYYHNYIQSCKEMDFVNANFFLHIYYDYFQNRSYSSLNKSLLYYHFKYYKQATISLKESIKIAQQNNEHESLLLSLIILYKIKMIEYFHNESKNVELFILQALKFAQTQPNQSLSFISFFITLDYIQFKLLTGFHDEEIRLQLYLLLKKCEQVSFQELQEFNQFNSKIPLFPKSLLNHVKLHFYRFIGDRLLYQCHLRLCGSSSMTMTTTTSGHLRSPFTGRLKSPLRSPLILKSPSIQSPLRSPSISSNTTNTNTSSSLQSPSSSKSCSSSLQLGFTRDFLDLYSDYELLSSKSIPNSDHTCYRIIIAHFIQLQDRENVNLLMNQFRNMIDPSLTIDQCDLLYLESLIAYYMDENIHQAISKFISCFKLAEKFNFIQLLSVYLENCELLKNKETSTLLMSYLFKAIDYCEKNHLETYKSRCLLYLNHHPMSFMWSCDGNGRHGLSCPTTTIMSMTPPPPPTTTTTVMTSSSIGSTTATTTAMTSTNTTTTLPLSTANSIPTSVAMTSTTTTTTTATISPLLSPPLPNNTMNTLLTHGSQTDIAYYYEILGTRYNHVEYLKKSLSLYLKSFCLIQSRFLCYKLAHLTKDVYYCKLYCNIHKELRKSHTSVLLQNDTPLPLDTIIDRSVEYFKMTLKSIQQI
nr:unnamed protein product [Naegleria fowleri]